MAQKKHREKWKTQRHFTRYREIIGALVRHGFGEFLDRSHLAEFGPIKRIRPQSGPPSAREHSKWVRIRLVLEELGVTYIKFGQTMSNRPDILPDELITELEKLQCEVPALSSGEAEEILRTELGKPIEEVFRFFNSEPLASASISQVHAAELFSGERVVIKIQRPGLEEIITTDIEIMHFFASLFEKLVLRDAISATAVIEEFGQSLRREIDFVQEAANIRKFSAQFQGEKGLYVPAVYQEYTTKKILVMERVDGIRICDIRSLLSAGANPQTLARRGALVVARQIFEYGFFHADPHPGNLLVLDNERICFLDFGMMGFLLPRHREILVSLMIALIEKNERRFTQELLALSLRRPPGGSSEALEYEIFQIMELYADASVESVNLGDLVTRVLRLVISSRIQMPPGFFLLAKALVIIEGVALRLSPDFRMINEVEPVIRGIFLRNLKPEKLVREIGSLGWQTVKFVRSLPRDLSEVLRTIKDGRITLHIDSADLHPILRKTDQITARLSSSLVLASLVVGSSIVINARIPPLWNNLSLIGLSGFLGAGFLGFGLLISLIRSSRMRDK
ncbi:MAG: AarF/ABC1/UbiB kinase family protein [Spirochaetales bacterium]|jgi:ubiquinone biosynthesis protein|nr:AarF/ABC1/UbiB kinase family protein [Spirochaetales bacterium]